MYKLAIVGLGKMGGSILEGILSANLFDKSEILLGLHDPLKANEYINKGFNATSDINDVLDNSQIILVAIKPQGFKDSFVNAKNYDFKGRCIISIMAGIKIETLEEFFKNASIFRAMPNTPALIRAGVSTICYNFKNDYESRVKKIFDSFGNGYFITEDLMDASLPLNGSMPAYLYLFAKDFIDNGVANGIDYETAKALTANSIIASAKMILESPDSIDTLINNVCSKGGTTIAGLNELYNNGFEDAIKKCYEACMNRSIELAKK